MAVTRREAGTLAAAAMLAVAMPAWLLRPADTTAPSSVRRPAPLVIPAAAPLSAAFARPLFGQAAGIDAETPLPPDAPELVGIAGRIGRDAVALVRGGDGRSRTLQPGEAVDGWTLESLALDAAFFTRGTQRLRVPLPAGDAAPGQ